MGEREGKIAMTNSWLRWAVSLPGFLALAVLAVPTKIGLRSEFRWLMLAVLVGSGVAWWQSFRAERRLRRLRVKTLQLFQVLNAPGSLRDLVQHVTGFMQAWIGCSAVGLRLRDEDGFPYFETRGSPATFVLAGTQLCCNASAGDGERVPVRSTGDCMCSHILAGRHGPPRTPVVAQSGRRLNGGEDLPFSASARMRRQNRLRYHCNSKGYESVALVALGEGPETIGLLQFSDARKGMFASPILGELEEVADLIALSLRQRCTQELLAKNETRYRRIIETADEGILIFDAQHHITYVNARLAEIMGYPPEQLLGYSFERFLFPEDLPAHGQQGHHIRYLFPAFRKRLDRNGRTGVHRGCAPRSGNHSAGRG